MPLRLVGTRTRTIADRPATGKGLVVVNPTVPRSAPPARHALRPPYRTGQATGPSRGSTRIFSLLIAGEAAFAFLLLAGSGLMMHSLIRLGESDHGFRPDHVLTMRVPIGTLTKRPPTGRYDNKPRQMAHYQELVERLHQIPGARYAAIVNNPPLSSVNTTPAFGRP